MLLKKIIIDNFRSVEHLEIDIIDIAGCKMHTFFGINETGKSNILKAIALLNPEATVNYEFDCNKNAAKHNYPISVKFLFDVALIDTVLENIPKDDKFQSLLSQTVKVEKIIQFDEKSTREEYYRLTNLSLQLKVLEGVNEQTGEVKEITEAIVSTRHINDFDDTLQYIDERRKSSYDRMIPETILWKPSSDYLITNPINLQQFGHNPDMSIPLKQIFHLAGYSKEEITSNVERILSNGDVRLEFEEQLSEAITTYINKIWSEYHINIKVRLENNSFCEIYIEEKDTKMQTFKMEQRSDGFKQFISILLSLSAQNTTKQLTNKVVLLDEPEKSLHPGSIKCLRDELLRISQNNIVLASSHSIFMVDKKNLERHFIVTKEKSITTIEQVNPKAPIQDEIIYNSLGTSIFELIEPNMLIFEGTIDKDIFDAFTLKFNEEVKPSRIQTISATGAKPIPNYVKFFHNKFVKGFVVVDSDKDGRDAINAIGKQDKEFVNSVFEIKNLVSLNKNEATLEDLLPEKLVLSCAAELYVITVGASNGTSILNHIKNIKENHKIYTDGKLEELKKLIVRKVIDDINNKDKTILKEEYVLYYEFMNSLHSKIKAVN